MATQYSANPDAIREDVRRDVRLKEIDVQIAQIEASPELPDWKKKLLKTQLNLEKKNLALSASRKSLQEFS